MDAIRDKDIHRDRRAIIHLIGDICGITKVYSLFIFLIHWINELRLTDSITIGINEWLAPQISEH